MIPDSASSPCFDARRERERRGKEVKGGGWLHPRSQRLSLLQSQMAVTPFSNPLLQASCIPPRTPLFLHLCSRPFRLSLRNLPRLLGHMSQTGDPWTSQSTCLLFGFAHGVLQLLELVAISKYLDFIFLF